MYGLVLYSFCFYIHPAVKMPRPAFPEITRQEYGNIQRVPEIVLRITWLVARVLLRGYGARRKKKKKKEKKFHTVDSKLLKIGSKESELTI